MRPVVMVVAVGMPVVVIMMVMVMIGAVSWMSCAHARIVGLAGAGLRCVKAGAVGAVHDAAP